MMVMRVRVKKLTIPDTASSAIGRSGQYEKLGQPCLFHIGRNPVRMDLDAFAYPKNSPIKYQFDEV